MTEKCVLIKPDISFKEKIEDFKKEMLAVEEVIPGTLGLREMEVEEWLDHIKDLEEVEEKEASEEFLYVRESDQKILGICRFTHSLNKPVLRDYAGHIGYSIRPSERRKGYATQMLSDVLKVCKRQGIYEIMISCNSSSSGSRKAILRNGGIYERTVYIEAEKSDVEIYWIDLENPFNTICFCYCMDREMDMILIDETAFMNIHDAIKRERELRKKDGKRWIIRSVKVKRERNAYK